VDAPNYLAELVCRRKQEKENSGSLPIKFWNHPKYKTLYIREVSQARVLLRTYSSIAIIDALNDYRSRFILSLRNKKLIRVIEDYQKKIPESQFTESQPVEEVKKVAPLPSKKNILDLL
jgi:hypothetical protein